MSRESGQAVVRSGWGSVFLARLCDNHHLRVTFLRGPVDAADFKTYVFPLLFFKRISDVHGEEYQAALAEAAGDEELVGHGVQQHADGGNLMVLAGQVAVQSVGDGRQQEDSVGHPLFDSRGEVVAGEHPDEHRNTGDAAEGDRVGQIEQGNLPTAVPGRLKKL